MKIWVFDDNLLWTSRLLRALAALGYEASAHTGLPTDEPPADAALVNLSCRSIDPVDLVPHLEALGVRTVGFAGHKEKELLAAGTSAGCRTIATNGEVAANLQRVLARVFSADR